MGKTNENDGGSKVLMKHEGGVHGRLWYVPVFLCLHIHKEMAKQLLDLPGWLHVMNMTPEHVWNAIL